MNSENGKTARKEMPGGVIIISELADIEMSWAPPF